MNLNTQVEELEKRLSAQNKEINKNKDTLASQMTSLGTEMSSVKQNINTLQQDVSTLKQDVTSLEGDMTSLSTTVSGHTSSLSSLSTQVSNHGNDIQTLTTSITNNSNNLQNLTTTVNNNSSTLSNLSTQVTTNSNNISNLITSVDDLETSVGNLETSIGNIETSVEDLETSVNTLNTDMEEVKASLGGGSSSIYNTGVYENLLVGSKTSSGPRVKIFMRCDTGCTVKGKIIAHIKELPTITSITASLYINDALISTIEKTGSFSGTIDFEMPISFMPEEISNKIEINFGSAISASVVDTVDIDLDGQNIMILNRDKRFHFWAFRGVYYMSFNESNHGYFIEQAKASFDLNATKTEFPYSSNGGGEANGFKYYRRVAFVTDHYNLLTMREQLYTEGEDSLFVTSRFGSNQTVIKNYDNNTLDGHLFFRSDYQTYCICYTLEDMSIVIGNYVPLETEGEPRPHPTLNGTTLENKYLQCIPVYDFYMGDRTVSGYTGFILLDKYGKLWFLPRPDATYMVEIGEGVQPNAYLQEDDLTINVYYRFESSVIKKVLKRADRESPFVLQDGQTVYPMTQEFIELDGSGSIRRIGNRLVVFS